MLVILINISKEEKKLIRKDIIDFIINIYKVYDFVLFLLELVREKKIKEFEINI